KRRTTMQEAKKAVVYLGTFTKVPQECLHSYDIGALLGVGSYATAYSACKNKDCGYVAKVVLLSPRGQEPGEEEPERTVRVKLPEGVVPEEYREARELR